MREAELAAFASEFAEALRPGSIIGLIGDLGTGKTTFTKYLAKGLGIRETVSSPTFTLIHEYTSGRLPLYHMDVYRLNSLQEMDELGYEDYFFGQGVTVIEWADRIAALLPEDAICIRISYGQEAGTREIEIL
ncbi:MAG: tRNA (adenosine(37)-N6)-threonylcarbamoyltransferase complex ATPase subunit type 1 TsaE [Clostridiales Family XIII bacterium]|jgi:tRNA threonylcarbamoyladenosine biosynthesis protein TsaE|nr:tRNA (adenosine(37)-N6)-threonylcarbamoyltransferase complex ATPase subunit type 1 TsaE [Clostridiales Family XIII bacterium]